MHLLAKLHLAQVELHWDRALSGGGERRTRQLRDGFHPGAMTGPDRPTARVDLDRRPPTTPRYSRPIRHCDELA